MCAGQITAGNSGKTAVLQTLFSKHTRLNPEACGPFDKIVPIARPESRTRDWSVEDYYAVTLLPTKRRAFSTCSGGETMEYGSSITFAQSVAKLTSLRIILMSSRHTES